MAAELKQHLGADATLTAGSGGIFEVRVDDKVVFSKRQVGRFPEEGEVLGILAQP